MRFGKLPPRLDYRTLRLASFLSPDLAAPPPAVDTLARVLAVLHPETVETLFPMDGNDTAGDCTIAALAHAVTTARGMIGQDNVMPAKDVLKLYWRLTGGVDSGLVVLDVMNYWRRQVVAHDRIEAYVSIAARDHRRVQQAIQLFGGVYIGFQVQERCIEEFDARAPWTPGPLTNDGHAVYVVGYDPQGVTVLTWGSTQQGTWGWWDECVDEVYAVIGPEAQSHLFAPGFNLAQLRLALAAVAG